MGAGFGITLPEMLPPPPLASEMKCRALSVLGRDPQTAGMRFHNGTADRQSHAAALGFCGEEGVEDFVRFSGRQSWFGVAD